MIGKAEFTGQGLHAYAKRLREELFPGLDLGWISFCHLPKAEFGRCYPCGVGDLGGRMILVNHFLRRNEQQLRETLIHEMIHLRLWDRGARGFEHGLHFQDVCRQVGLDPRTHC